VLVIVPITVIAVMLAYAAVSQVGRARSAAASAVLSAAGAPGGRQRLRTPGDTANRPTSANSANVASARATTSVAPPTTFS
jgi:hypothetical protein